MQIQINNVTASTDLSMGADAGYDFFEKYLPQVVTALAMANIDFNYNRIDRTITVGSLYNVEATQALEEANLLDRLTLVA